MAKPIVIDLFCGLGGWTKGFLAEGYEAIGFDIERHVYGDKRYPGQLVLQDALTLHGRQFRDAAAIVASPPCQKYSYMAMPWTRAKDLAKWYRAEASRIVELNALFNACFRLQREASQAAGRHIPLVVENVKGAQPWVGEARAHFGSFYLWGDVESIGGRIVAPRPVFGDSLRVGRAQKHNPDGTSHGQGPWFAVADSKMRGARSTKNEGGSWFGIAHNTESGTGQNPDGRALKVPSESGRRRDMGNGARFTSRDCGVESRNRGIKQHGSSREWFDIGIFNLPSSSVRRKEASAQIAEIPLDLARWVARSFKPNTRGAGGGIK